MSNWLFAPTFISALGSALMAGLFFVFSNAVMTAFGKLSPATGIAAMQAINIWILNPVFAAVFFGTAAFSALLAIAALLNLGHAWSLPLLAGSLCYLFGAPLVTMIFNVPLNNRLAAASPETAEAARLWAEYLRIWTAWNHLRTILCLAATGLFIWALCRG
ncbi:anthrone oxygenase family protein [Bradyrhizobium sp. LHD-71]|uniref:anthrone oxygenase family protein n=1 Tax=Bradyrhizobium sp. LHD-71 TaxID=3072141 RepID=UPI00280EBD73|nr:anthrone oxygenase family protein [Bradyrhizobium sp. LHD-71]MDQ8730601.1 DUF1772 domain-containing protein [Bradyrhizobium sp. LHD-71]